MSCWSGAFPWHWGLRMGWGHHSEVPTWAGSCRPREIVGEGLGWHITPCAPEEPSTFLSLASPSCGLQTQHHSSAWVTCKGKASMRILNYVFYSRNQTASRTQLCSCVLPAAWPVMGWEQEKGEIGSPSHMWVSNTSERAIPSTIGAENRSRGLQE